MIDQLPMFASPHAKRQSMLRRFSPCLHPHMQKRNTLSHDPPLHHLPLLLLLLLLHLLLHLLLLLHRHLLLLLGHLQRCQSSARPI